ncbi:COP9 signalosome complex subunit 2 [Rhizoctonia solani AG-3 Rhs1AP]|uniref:COP9 signalosome complex subunit 2 n=2 Tax=Rhizoctonia solani AG-3 TaxID=1086053 RepID=A0A074RIU5_9AGAM|nr:COP9 signalosome complex subunit 2 [Rhizoctonia solani AG-3 Rhs1AP]KEP45280.1 COP9 signalosome complex subunit 2 [Rhizoctonia solani 123E]
MDDDDMDYLEGGDEDDFEYSGEESDDQGADADAENQYYTAKSLKEDDPAEALKSFRKIIDTEKDKKEHTDWGFKALKQSSKISFLLLGRPDDALKTYIELLGYTRSAVTRNYSEKTINGILDYVGGQKPLKKGQKKASAGVVSVEILEKFYEVTKSVLIETKNERLSTKINLKLAKLWLDRKEYTRLMHVISELHRSATSTTSSTSDDTSDQSRGTLLLEIYALEIQMYNETKNWKKLKEIYNKSSEVRSAIPHPRIMGVIKECGGKMWMGEKQWARASTDFFESFRNYDESGAPQRIQVLKYLVLANLLMGSGINPFDSQEAKPYKSDPQITAMTDLVGAYQRREVHEAERILRDHRDTIMDDPFIASYIGDLLRSLRTSYLIDLIKPYTRLELGFLAKQLNVEKNEVEELLIGLILEGKVEGKIDQVAQRLEITKTQPLARRRYAALDKWTGALENLNGAISGKVIGSAGDARGEFERMGALMM